MNLAGSDPVGVPGPERPVRGWGYNSKVVLADYRDFADNLRIDHAHNRLFQNLLSVGVFGTLPLIGLLLKHMGDLGRGRPAALSVLHHVHAGEPYARTPPSRATLKHAGGS